MSQMKEVKLDIEALKAEISASSEKSKIFIGADSKTLKRGKDRYCAFCVTVVIHIDGKHGGKIYNEITIERDYGEVTAPRARLMTEVYKVVEIATQIIDHVGDRKFEIHLDVSTDPQYKSNGVHKEACGYVFGMFGIEPKTKPFAWCASYAADKYAVKAAKSAKRS